MSLPARLGTRHPKLMAVIEQMEDKSRSRCRRALLAACGPVDATARTPVPSISRPHPKRYYLELRLKKARSLLLNRPICR